MILNYDCIRDLLVVLEEKLEFSSISGNKRIYLDEVYDSFLLSTYSCDDIVYTTSKLIEAGLINAHIEYASGKILRVVYSSITYSGHAYLENVRNDNDWKKIKDFFVKAGKAMTIESINALAIRILSGF